jgi:signal transduction histidine kinase
MTASPHPSRGYGVLRRVLISLVLGALAYVLTELTDQPEIWGLMLSVFVGGVTLVTQFLVDFEARLGVSSVRLDEYTADVRTIASQRDEEAKQLRLLIQYVENRIPQVISETFHLGQREEPLVRELAHSINTPLAQMEATLLAHDNKPLPTDAAVDLLAGVRICKSFLAAFREVATLAQETQGWEPTSINGIMTAAARLYAAQAGESVSYEISLPDDVPGYGKNYLIALLLPLLENAFEAVPHDGKIEVTWRTGADVYLFEVSNDSEHRFDPTRDIYARNWSSKPGHEGLGLTTVRNVLAGHRDGEVSHTIDHANRVTFTVRLPRRRAAK